MHGTWIDILIVGFILYFAFKGWREGLFFLTVSLAAFLAALYVSLRFNGIVSGFITDKFGVEYNWSRVISYIVLALGTEAILSSLGYELLRVIPVRFHRSAFNQLLGALLSVLQGLITATFFLVVVMALPLKGTIKQDIQSSAIAPYLLTMAQTYSPTVVGTIEDSAANLSRFLTIKPKSTERIPLAFTVSPSQLHDDLAGEMTLFADVNREREKVGVAPLVMDETMRTVARNYSRHMFLARYFAHFDENGKDVGNRLDSAGVHFLVAGENLAYAPDVDSAHRGLMNSEGHRHNILDPEFHRVGIGIVDAGVWGKMFTQVFAD